MPKTYGGLDADELRDLAQTAASVQAAVREYRQPKYDERKADARFHKVAPAAAQALLDDCDALRTALQGLMGAAWHDNDCAHVTDREPCDCGFAAAYAAAEKALAQENPDAQG